MVENEIYNSRNNLLFKDQYYKFDIAEEGQNLNVILVSWIKDTFGLRPNKNKQAESGPARQ